MNNEFVKKGFVISESRCVSAVMSWCEHAHCPQKYTQGEVHQMSRSQDARITQTDRVLVLQ